MIVVHKATNEEVALLNTIADQVEASGKHIHFRHRNNGSFVALVMKPGNDKGEALMVGRKLSQAYLDALVGIIAE